MQSWERGDENEEELEIEQMTARTRTKRDGRRMESAEGKNGSNETRRAKRRSIHE